MALKARLAVWGKAAAAAYGVVLVIGLPLAAWVIYHVAATYYEPALGRLLVGLPLHAVLTAPAVTLYLLISYRALRFFPALIARPFKGSGTFGVIFIAAIAALPALFAWLNGEHLIASAMAVIVIAAFLVIDRITARQISAGEQAWGKAVLATFAIGLAGCLAVTALYTVQQLNAPGDLAPAAWARIVGGDGAILAILTTPYALAAYAVLNLARRRLLRLAKGEDKDEGVFLMAGVAAAPLLVGLWFSFDGAFKGLFMVIAVITVVMAFSAIWRITSKSPTPAA